MIRPALLIALVADAALCVLLGLGLPLLVATIGWLATAGWQTGPWSLGLDAASAIWALGLGGGVGLTIEPETFPQLQLGAPFSFVVSIAPLAITALVAGLGWRSGGRMLDDEQPWLGLAAGIVGFAGIAAFSLQFVSLPGLRIDVPGAVVTGTLVWAGAVLAGARAWELVPWVRLLGDRADAVLGHLTRALRLGAALIAGSLGLGAALVLLAVLVGYGRVVGLMQGLQLDVWGVIAAALAQLAYAPTLVVWAVAWMLGPGVALGTGSLANPGGTEAGPLPVAPLLGLVPDALPPVWWGVVALPLGLAAVVTMFARSSDDRHDRGAWWERLITPVSGAALAALGLGLLAHLSRGALGPGRLVDFGPHPGWVMLAAFGLFAAGAVLGAYVRFGALPMLQGERPADAEPRYDDLLDGERTAPPAWVRGMASRLEGAMRGDGAATAAREEPDEPKRPDEPKQSDESKQPDESKRPDEPKRSLAETIDLSEVRAERRRRARESKRPTAEAPEAPAPRAPKPGPRPKSAGDLGEVLRRPGEPDIYADLDDDL